MANKVVASARFNQLQWRLIFVIFALAALLGFYGQVLETSWPPAFSPVWFRELSNDLFITLLYFTFSAPVDAAGSNLALHVARFLAPLATLSAIIKIVIEAAYASWLQAQLKNQRKHIVVVGFGNLGQQIARQFLLEGRRVVALDRRPTSDAVELAAHLAIPMVVGDGTRTEDLVEVAVARAETIFFVTENDIVNLEACAAASGLMSTSDRVRTQLLVHLGNVELSQQLQDYERRIAYIGDKRTIVKFFNLNDLLARQLLTENPLHKIAHWLCQDRVHVLIVGLNDISKKIIFHTLLSQRTHRLGSPHFTIIDPEASSGRKAFEAAWPGIADIATVNYQDIPLDPMQIETAIGDAGKMAPLTATVLCLSNEVENLTVALRIHSAAARGQIHAGNIMVRRDQTSDFFERLSSIARYDLANLLFDFGEGDHQLFVRQITGEDDILARRLHEAYCDQRKEAGDPPSASTSPWDILPETSRRANRRAADHIWTKLEAVGYRIDRETRTLPWLVDRGARLEEENTLSALAHLEHDRWWADRVVDGWRYGSARDNKARVHPDMRPFEELDFAVRSKDEEQNGFITSLLKQTTPKDAVSVPIERTLGLEFTGTGETLTPDECAAQIKDQFSGEAFLVLCETGAPEEDVWLSGFIKALGSNEFDARLVRLFQADRTQDLNTFGTDDKTLWLNLRATGAVSRDGYPIGMSREAFLDARADWRVTISL